MKQTRIDKLKRINNAPTVCGLGRVNSNLSACEVNELFAEIEMLQKKLKASRKVGSDLHKQLKVAEDKLRLGEMMVAAVTGEDPDDYSHVPFESAGTVEVKYIDVEPLKPSKIDDDET